jgi:hypothetical protein
MAFMEESTAFSVPPDVVNLIITLATFPAAIVAVPIKGGK